MEIHTEKICYQVIYFIFMCVLVFGLDLLLQKRDKLTRTKQARDHLRIDNHRLRQNCGLLGNEPLLRDFENRKDESGELRDQLERLKMEHAELTLSCNGVRKKIDQARSWEKLRLTVVLFLE